MAIPSTLIILVGAIIYLVLYFTYGRGLQKHVVRADAERKTPAVRLTDGVDYVPTNKYILFGHHFASIAGAAPIVGPAIAIAWGWLPCLLWVWFANVFIGAVHDYLALMSSVRYDGKSIQWISGRVMEKRTGYVFQLFVYFTMLMVLSAFASIIANTFIASPEAATAAIILMVTALLCGWLMYKVKLNFKLCTVIGLILLVFGIFLGMKFPLALTYHQWMIFLLVYIVVAASLPVWTLLQPRDYLNSFILYAGLALGGIGLIIAFKSMGTPLYTAWSAPTVEGRLAPFWPCVPLVIGCGALSGFHAIVGSGTTSKQLDNEINALAIGYGGMFTEGFLSTIVIASIACFGFAALGTVAEELAIAGISLEQLKTTSYFNANYLAAIRPLGGPVGIFSASYGKALESSLHIPYKWGSMFAALWVSSFALTTLDTSNRLARFTWMELIEPIKDKTPRAHKVLVNRWFASAALAVIAIYLAWTGDWSRLWPAFAGYNQLLASIALMTSSIWITKVLGVVGKYKYATIIPALFLWVTVTVAFIWWLVVVHSTLILNIIMLAGLGLNSVLFYDYIVALKRPAYEEKMEVA
jgi:carbon starvation protein